MREEYLHQIWKTKRLPMHDLQLIDGRKLTIQQVGWHNHESGPDFFNGSIGLDGITWNGNIEIHIKSSDWYAHQHQIDPAYDNVILHVVYQYDKPVIVNGEELPTLELKSYLDQNDWSSYDSLIKNQTWIPCEKSIHEVDELFVSMQIENALVERLERKSTQVELRYQLLNRNLQQLQYEVIAQSFGAKVNALPFVELTQHISLKILWREGKDAVFPLLLGASGFLEAELDEIHFKKWQKEWRFMVMKHQFSSMDLSTWKSKGLRPPGFPKVRITQFAAVISNLQSDFSIFMKSPEELLAFFKFDNRAFETIEGLKPLTISFQHSLIINSLVPLLWWYGNHLSNEIFKQKALILLSKIPAENNEIIQRWKNLGIRCKSAEDSQGLLELKNEICTNKLCLTCKIGNKVLGR